MTPQHCSTCTIQASRRTRGASFLFAGELEQALLGHGDIYRRSLGCQRRRKNVPARRRKKSTPVGDSAPVTRILASAVQDRSAPYPHSWTDRSSTCPRGMQISRSRPRVDHVLTVEFFGKCRESKNPRNQSMFSGALFGCGGWI